MLTAVAPAEIRAVLEHLYPVRKTVVRRVVNRPVLPDNCDMNCDKCKNMKCSNKGGEGWFEKEVHEEVVDEEELAAAAVSTTRTQDELLADMPKDILDDVAKLIDDLGEDSIEWLRGDSDSKE